MLVSTRDRFTSKVRLGRTVVTTIVNAWTPLKVFTVAVTGKMNNLILKSISLNKNEAKVNKTILDSV